MKKIDTPTLRPIIQSKKNPKVKDPVRYPNIIDPLENLAKREYSEILEVTLEQLAKKMVEFKTK